ncbi:hypothetical protein CYLTODRAFT_416777 [Cylindrobasidium torrendii FP15055 ss-10]|uniref:C3H1-type domain-containing protein n=1 Tax=Cylindrobasidium torrendii FP15055 ss-10 TaxID=1314674 RepID=A0A0D7BU46_9AGAR|nr:hypothetical protein CYLTODRAFT_416777 [Cylindrobasidium torrendii FP15055 ss-10]
MLGIDAARLASSQQQVLLERECARLQAELDHVKFTMPPPMVVVAIDGTSALFDTRLLSLGYQGAQEAARSLTAVVQEALEAKQVHFPNTGSKLRFMVNLYIDTVRAEATLIKEGLCSHPGSFRQFLREFSSLAPTFCVIEVSDRLEAQTKIIDSVSYYAKMPSAHLFVVSTPLEHSPALIQDNISFLSAPQKQFFRAPSLFMTYCIPSPPPPPSFTGNTSPGTPLWRRHSGGLPSPKSPASRSISSMTSSEASGMLNPELPLHKQSPPPCNEHYIMGACTKEQGSCKYGHDYKLSPGQLEHLAISAKKAPCNYIKSGEQCPHTNCCWGHVCPNGPDCPYQLKGRCWFREAMHDPRP